MTKLSATLTSFRTKLSESGPNYPGPNYRSISKQDQTRHYRSISKQDQTIRDTATNVKILADYEHYCSICICLLFLSCERDSHHLLQVSFTSLSGPTYLTMDSIVPYCSTEARIRAEDC